MAALSAVRWEPGSHARYRLLTDRGKPRKVAMVAVMSRLACLLNTPLREDRIWRDRTALPGPAGCRMSPSARPPRSQLAVRLELREDRLPQPFLPENPLDSQHGSIQVSRERSSGMAGWRLFRDGGSVSCWCSARCAGGKTPVAAEESEVPEESARRWVKAAEPDAGRCTNGLDRPRARSWRSWGVGSVLSAQRLLAWLPTTAANMRGFRTGSDGDAIGDHSARAAR